MPAALISRADAIARIAEVFREHGFDGAALSAISQATGLGKGSLYNYFPGGKDEMAAIVLAQIEDWFEREIFAPLRDETQVPVALGRMFAHIDRYFQGGGRVCLVGAFALDATRDRFADAVQEYFAKWVSALGVSLRRAGRSEERRVGKGCGRTVRSRWSPSH